MGANWSNSNDTKSHSCHVISFAMQNQLILTCPCFSCPLNPQLIKKFHAISKNWSKSGQMKLKQCYSTFLVHTLAHDQRCCCPGEPYEGSMLWGLYPEPKRMSFRKKAYDTTRERLKSGIKEAKRGHRQKLERPQHQQHQRYVAVAPKHQKLPKQERSHHLPRCKNGHKTFKTSFISSTKSQL